MHMPQSVQEVHALFDKNGDGRVEKKDVPAALYTLGELVPLQ